MRLFLTGANKGGPPNVGVSVASGTRATRAARRAPIPRDDPRVLFESSRATPRVDVPMARVARVRAVRSRARRMTRTHRGGRGDRAGNCAGSGDGVRHAVVNAETLCVCDVRLPSSETLGRSVGRARPWGGASEGVRANSADVAEKAKSEAFPGKNSWRDFFRGPRIPCSGY